MRKSTILARSLARRLGLTRLVRAVLPSRDYEEDFSTALMSEIREGDVVWDIGANVGFYTRKFVKAVGPAGVVVAFEPAPHSAAELPQPDETETDLRIVNAALGSATGAASISINEDQTSPTNRIVDENNGSHATVSVPIYRGDDAWKEFGLPVPNVIKLDVEGFEGDCIAGLDLVLQQPELRAIFIEVHFGLLADRGQQFAPVEIERTLRSRGFNITWVDASHIRAARGC